MSKSDEVEQVRKGDIELDEGMLGFEIRIDGGYVGAIEGVPGRLEHIEVDPHWEGKGVARAALNEFIAVSRAHGMSEVTTNNAVHPAMEHILETEGFEEQTDSIGWVRELH